MAIPFAVLGAGIWGVISAAVVRFLMFVIPAVISWGLLALGISFVTYVGLNFAMDAAVQAVMDRYSAIPVELISVIELIGVTDAILIITSTATSAIAVRVAMGVTRMKQNRPGKLVA